jgi:succinoglycan biosynthesis transport protein ExoP
LSCLLGVLRRRFLVIAAATFALSALAGAAIVVTSKSLTIDYEGSFSRLVEPATAEGLLSKQLNNTLAADIVRINIEGISLVDYETPIRILRSPKMMQPVIQELRAWYPNMNYSKLISQMSIDRIRDRKDGKQQGTKILHVRYKDSDKKKLRRIG